MKVLFVASEVTPFAKVGGIADVVGALPIALRALGVDVRVMVPRYEQLAGQPRLTPFTDGLKVSAGGHTEFVNVARTTLPNSDVPVYFLENATHLSHGWPIYDVHGEADPFANLRRFLFFSAATVEALTHIGWVPNIVHCHDWFTGLVPTLLGQRGFSAVRTVYTIHNLAYQGAWNPGEALTFVGLQGNEMPTLIQRDRHGDFNLMQQGIVTSTRVNTVSPNYAREIVTPEHGEGLDPDLRRRGNDFTGILNGIDVARFDPQSDPSLRVRYSATTLEQRRENTLALHEQCGFAPQADVPTLGFVGRLAEQKGLDLVADVAERLVRAKARLVVLGTGLPAIEERLSALAAKHPQNIAVRIGFDATFAQHIYAGADLFLMPSKFEPCGLGQMIAMRYGAVPIVHATGGLFDTVPDVDKNSQAGLGFAFSAPTADALWGAVRRGLTHWKDRRSWPALQRRCMSQDFSWRRSARSYLALYENVIR